MTRRDPSEWLVRQADAHDAEAVGALLHDFNREFDEPTPHPHVLAARILRLFSVGDTTVLLGGGGPYGLAVLRFRLALWSAAFECTLAELYVVPDRRGQGLGRALAEAAVNVARRRGADRIEVATGDKNVGARALYESLGFTSGDGTSTHYLYQRELT